MTKLRCDTPCRVENAATPYKLTRYCVRPAGHSGYCNHEGDWCPLERWERQRPEQT